jgi:hypothetical protein
MARRRYGGGNVGMQRDWVVASGMAAPARRGRRTTRIAVEVAQRSREGGGGGGDPLGGGCAAQSHGEEIVVIFYFILLVNLLSILLPFLCRRQRNLLRP